MRDIRLTLSTSEANNHIGQITIRQDDDNTQRLIVDITENGKPKNLSGLTVFFNAMIDDTVIARDLATIEGKSRVSYILKWPFYQSEGRVKAYFSFERDTSRESTADFVYFVTRGTCRNIKQGNYIYEFENLKNAISKIIGNGDLLPLLKQINQLQNIVDSYQAETNYNFSLLKDKTEQAVWNTQLECSKKISEHEKKRDNPHKVTAEQVGTYTSSKIDSQITNNNVKSKLIFNSESGKYLDEKETYKYNLSSNQEFVGLKLIFSGYDRKNNVTLPYGYRSFTFDSYDVYAGAQYLPFVGIGGDTGFKEVKVTSTGVTGTENNSTHERSYNYVLRRVIVYYREKI